MIDFSIKGNFDLLSSNSKEPSNTMTINPIVPRIGNNPLRLGTLILKISVICCKPHPKISNKITEGILVLDVVKSKIYAIIISTQKAIINVFVMELFLMLFSQHLLV